ncbi:matrix metalloproteinase-14-like [Periplaneta americana]|uniref:matrix metalloproteinase-14-like n=1 Tax=Periplaneta americana TaxID=6978 RepID=UPI0037E81758
MYCLCVLVSLCAQEILGAPMTMDMGAMAYLVQFGYMDPQVMKNDSGMTDDKMEEMMTTAVADFQKFVGLEATGKVNEETHDMMQTPRCGVKDKHDFDEKKNMGKRYKIFGGPWKKHNLTYSISRFPSGIDLVGAAIEEEIQMALATWAAVADLTFMPVAANKRADINITFVSGDHDDSQPFDGKGMVLAHAFHPPSGKVHFDNDEPWTIRKYKGQNLLLVAVHEFGHALGLDHSNTKKSIMYPFATSYYPSFKLHNDDIKGIQSLYGKKKVKSPNICTDSTIDAIFQHSPGVMYVLKEEYYWKLAADGPLSGYPRLISHHWPGLPGNVDAAFRHPSGNVYFFKGNKTWAYNYTTLLPDYPKLISEEWKGIPDNVDAAMHFDSTRFFFFKGDLYWKYDSKQSPQVRTEKYPKLILKWDGIPGGLDDVLRIGTSVYFFRQGRYYRFNSVTGLIDSGCPDHPNYHRPTGTWWFRCKSDSGEFDEFDCQDTSQIGARSVNSACFPIPSPRIIIMASLILHLKIITDLVFKNTF